MNKGIVSETVNTQQKEVVGLPLTLNMCEGTERAPGTVASLYHVVALG